MSEIFRQIKEEITMQQVAQHLGFVSDKNGFICSPFKSEKTASCKLYEHSFYDFATTQGGDCIKFAAAILGSDNWTAAKYLVETFHLPISLSGSTDSRKQIQKRQQEQQKQQERQIEFRAALWREIAKLKTWEEVYRLALEKQIFPPLSELWGFCIGELQKVSYRLDILCAANQQTYRIMKTDIQQGKFSDYPQWLLDTLEILKEDGEFFPTDRELAQIQTQII